MKVFNYSVFLCLGLSFFVGASEKFVGQESELSYMCRIDDVQVREYLAQFQIKGFVPESGILEV